MKRRYPKVGAGEWVQPVRRGYKMACCDCGLVHTLNFRLAKRGERRWIQMQAFRDEQATIALRKMEKLPQAEELWK